MNKPLYLLDIIEETTVDGPGFRSAVYGAGCPHRCPGCHNPSSWMWQNGTPVSVEEIAEKLLATPHTNITFSGGDPLFQSEAFTQLARIIRSRSSKSIWCYTGYTYEWVEAQPHLQELLSYIEVLVDGRFVAELRESTLPFRGSSNQRLIDVCASQKAGKAIPWKNPHTKLFL